LFTCRETHDAELWWNQEIHVELERAGLVHEFGLS
jgi:hypothetical protein